MKNILKSALVIFILFVLVISCKEDDEPIPPIVYDSAELLPAIITLRQLALIGWLTAKRLLQTCGIHLVVRSRFNGTPIQ